MKFLLAVAIVAVLALAVSGELKCGAIEKFKVHHQWKEAFGTGQHRIDFGVALFRNLFQDYPEARALFTRVRGDNVYSAEFEAHIERILSSLDMLVDLLDDEPTLQAALAHLKAQHVERKIDPKYFDAFKDEILRTLPKYLGTRLDWDAFTACLNYIHSAIKE